MSQVDTITAIATPPGRGGVGILRISGPLSTTVAKVLLGTLPKPRQAQYLPFRDNDGSVLDNGIALFFPAPHSFTGEDVLELQGHGGPVILDLLLRYILTIVGIRIARPGEFSERAFINNKLDLTQAEAIADLIDASSVQAARSAVNSLQGAFSKHIHKLAKSLTNLRMYVESAIDFPDDDIDFLSDGKIESRLNQIIISLDRVWTKARQGHLLREGMKVVITGKPNSGKSSLLNALTGQDTAIVTSVAGTTRDVLREHIQIDGMPLYIIDTAGLCEASNEVECIGIERAWREIKQADHILLMVDGTTTPLSATDILWAAFIKQLPTTIPVTVLRNKADLTGETVAISKMVGYSLITLSIYSGMGVNILREHLKKIMGFSANIEGSFLARRRHLYALEITAKHLIQGKERLVHAYAGELLAEELRLAQQSLSEITGEFSSNDLLERIFSSFCIGK